MSILNDIMTIQEAAAEWNIDDSTLRHAIKKNKFKTDEVRKSANTWLVLNSAMIRLYGPKVKFINLFTTGYEGKTIETFINTLKENKVNIIVDVREIPMSRKKGFSKTSLSEILNENGIKYAHFKELGSPKNIREKLHSDHNYDEFFSGYRKYLETQAETMDIVNTAILSNKDTNFCLLCFEKDPKTCHRSVIADTISKSLELGVKIIDL
ncbi:MAG: hypothetical protein K0R50_1256 [Eubacterium sp.]|jgi:uncharacterized protein YeaO (DUF488 family)|nr:hypothetical protein [Eubacterium sp.]